MKFQPFILTIALILSLNADAATRVWSGAGTTANWTEAANWQTGTAPLSGDDLIFPQVSKKTVTNDFSTNTNYFNTVTITGTNYVISGNAVRLLIGLTNTAPSNTFQAPISFIGATNIISSADLNGRPFTLTGDIAQNSTFNNSNIFFIGGNINVSGNISSLHPIGISCVSGVLELSGSNTYSGGTFIYPAGTIRVSQSNALGGSFSYIEIESDATNRAGCLELTNNVTIQHQFYISSLTTNAPNFSTQILSKSGSNTITGAIEIDEFGSSNLNSVNICVSNGNLTISNTISGNSGIAKFGNGQLTYAASNSYTGLTSINEGLLLASMPSSYVPFGGDAFVSATFRTVNSFKMIDGHTFVDRGVIDLAGHTGIIPILTGDGMLTLNGGILDVGSSLGSGDFSGTIAGPGKFIKVGGQSQTLSGNNTHTNTAISQGTLIVNGVQTNSPITVGILGTLFGTGYCGSISTTGGQVGNLTPWGTLHVIGGVVLSNATFATALTNTNAYGQLDVTGNITLTNSTLLFTNTFFPPAGAQFTLVKNRGGAAITGTFTNASEGSILAKLVPFQLSYFGNGANDLTVTRTQPPAVFSSFKTTASAIQLTASGVANATYSFEASTNLIDWTNLSTMAPASSIFSFTNPITTLPFRFYRVKTL